MKFCTRPKLYNKGEDGGFLQGGGENWRGEARGELSKVPGSVLEVDWEGGYLEIPIDQNSFNLKPVFLLIQKLILNFRSCKSRG